MKKFCLLLLFLSVLSFSSVAASISGYYRIKNVAGSSGKCYVSVTGPYYGAPQETAVTKDTLAGTVVYISAEETSTSGTYKITSLRSQGVEILNVINAVKSRLQNMSEADFNTLWAKVEAKAASYSSKLAKFGINMDDFKYADFQSYVNNDIDYNLYLVSTGSNYYAIWNSPNVPAYFKNKSYTVLFFKIYFQDAVNALWSSVSSSLKTMVDARLTGDKAALIPIADNFIDNFQFGTKMYLTENTTTAIFNFANSSPSDNGKWTLEPVDATNYFAAAPKQYTVGTDNYYFTTLYTDFAYTLPSTVKAYKIPSATKIVRQGTNTCTYYVANGVEITGTVPIHTPVLLRCTSTAAADNILQPVVTGASPAPKKVTTATSDNLLVSTFFNETTTATSYLSLRYAAEEVSDDCLLCGESCMVAAQCHRNVGF
jgi:hypothetical protein